MEEGGVCEGEGLPTAVHRVDVTELGVGLVEPRDRERTGSESDDVRPGEHDEREPTSGQGRKPSPEAQKGAWSPRPDDDDVGRPDLEGEALEGRRRAATRQLSDATHLPGVEGGVGRGDAPEIEEEDARVTTGWEGFEHRGWGEEPGGGSRP